MEDCDPEDAWYSANRKYFNSDAIFLKTIVMKISV
jgi:hypothetical protein